MSYSFEGFKELSNMLEDCIKKAENPVDILEIGAKELVKDLLKLPKPMSKIRANGYTHLIKTFTYKKNEKEIEVGWGKYYGPMLENGTVKMRASPHIRPLWDKNKEKYYKKMINELGFN